jgi:hypothetical protein
MGERRALGFVKQIPNLLRTPFALEQQERLGLLAQRGYLGKPLSLNLPAGGSELGVRKGLAGGDNPSYIVEFKEGSCNRVVNETRARIRNKAATIAELLT